MNAQDDQIRDARAGDPSRSAWHVFFVSLKLGLTCFGGPIAHLGYFHAEFVERRKWLREHDYADLVALCQFLPGPTSSQVNLAIGLLRARWLGAFAAWIGFTLPSAVIMIAFAYGMDALGDLQHAGWLKGLQLAAVAVVAQAVWAMATKFCTRWATVAIALGAAVVMLFFASGFTQLLVIAGGCALGWILFRGSVKNAIGDKTSMVVPYGTKTGVVFLAAFVILLGGLPLLEWIAPSPALASFDSFYRTGSLVFGGGHVVLPLLRADTVTPGWISDDRFLAGYGAAQALPGPLFTFAAFLGTAMKAQPTGWLGGVWCLVALFLPSFLLVFGVLPFWGDLRRRAWAQAALQGANAAVVGLLLAALYHPVWTSSVHGVREFIVALGAYALLVFAKLPPWVVVVAAALSGALLFR